MGSNPHHMALMIGLPRTITGFYNAGADDGRRAAHPVVYRDVGLLKNGEAETAVRVGACGHAYRLEAHGRRLLSEVWAGVAPVSVALPPGSMRRGPGPRAGLVATGPNAGLWWSTSIAHAAAGPVVAAAVVIQRIDQSAGSPGITIGVDIEPVKRFVHPGVARLIAARAGAEPPVTNGKVPLLAVVCVKEAIYKADRRQSGRTLADYAWVEAWRGEADGWCGVSEAVDDRTQRFSVGVLRVRRNWVAFALAED